MLLNCGVREDSWESLGLQGDPTSQSQRKSVLNIHWRNDFEAETSVLWPPDAKSQLIRRDPDAGKDWRQEEKGMTEAEMVGWHHWLNGHKFEEVPGDGEGQGSLVCRSPWGRKQSDITERLNNNKKHLRTCCNLLVVIEMQIKQWDHIGSVHQERWHIHTICLITHICDES